MQVESRSSLLKRRAPEWLTPLGFLSHEHASQVVSKCCKRVALHRIFTSERHPYRFIYGFATGPTCVSRIGYIVRCALRGVPIYVFLERLDGLKDHRAVRIILNFPRSWIDFRVPLCMSWYTLTKAVSSLSSAPIFNRFIHSSSSCLIAPPRTMENTKHNRRP